MIDSLHNALASALCRGLDTHPLVRPRVGLVDDAAARASELADRIVVAARPGGPALSATEAVEVLTIAQLLTEPEDLEARSLIHWFLSCPTLQIDPPR